MIIKLLFALKGYTIYHIVKIVSIQNTMKKIFALIVALCSSLANANNDQQDIDLFIESFTHCDATFFSNMSNIQNKLSDYTKITPINNIQSYISVEDRTSSKKNHHTFSKPIYYHSLKLTGYYDSQLDLGKYGEYYFWGFIIDNPLQEIKSSFNFLSWNEMEKDSFYTTNTKIHFSEDSLKTWHENSDTITGVKTVPSQGTAEKLLLIEKSDDMIILACSIQGFFPPELLATIRPDLNNL